MRTASAIIDDFVRQSLTTSQYELVRSAINQARIETIKECAEKATVMIFNQAFTPKIY